MKLLDIARGWANVFRNSEETQELFERRIQVCDECPNKRQMSPTGQWITKLVNDEASIYYCGLCGCPLAAILRLADRACEIGKWKSETL